MSVIKLATFTLFVVLVGLLDAEATDPCDGPYAELSDPRRSVNYQLQDGETGIDDVYTLLGITYIDGVDTWFRFTAFAKARLADISDCRPLGQGWCGAGVGFVLSGPHETGTEEFTRKVCYSCDDPCLDINVTVKRCQKNGDDFYLYRLPWFRFLYDIKVSYCVACGDGKCPEIEDPAAHKGVTDKDSGDPCKLPHVELGGADRYINHQLQPGDAPINDHNTLIDNSYRQGFNTWYRFRDPDALLADDSVCRPTNEGWCGANNFPMTLSGPYQPGPGEFKRKICLACEELCVYDVTIKLCEQQGKSYYIYKLPLPPVDDASFCTMCLNNTESCIPEYRPTTTGYTDDTGGGNTPPSGPASSGTVNLIPGSTGIWMTHLYIAIMWMQQY